MFNINTFNEVVFNNSILTTDTKESLSYYIKYNDYFLHDGTTTISMIQYLDPKELYNEESLYGLNHGNFYNFQERKKQLKITGTIKTNTRAELLEEMRKIKALPQNGYLIIKEAGEIKQLKVVMRPKFIENHFNITFIQFEIDCESYDYLEDFVKLTYYGDWQTPKIIFSNEGTAESKVGIVVLVNSLYIPNITIKINGSSILINESFNSGDVLFLDGYTPTITKNGTLIDFTGEIPYLDAGYNEVEIIQNGYIDYIIYTNVAYK